MNGLDDWEMDEKGLETESFFYPASILRIYLGRNRLSSISATSSFSTGTSFRDMGIIWKLPLSKSCTSSSSVFKEKNQICRTPYIRRINLTTVNLQPLGAVHRRGLQGNWGWSCAVKNQLHHMLWFVYANISYFWNLSRPIVCRKYSNPNIFLTHN